jgi:hypothetical protein
MWRKAGTRVTVALAVALALVVVALVVTLSGAPLVVARVNTSLPVERLAAMHSGAGACQADELVPAGTSAIRLGLWSAAGPRLKLTVLSGTRAITSGAVSSGWTTGAVTVPVGAVAHTTPHARICFGLGRSPDEVLVIGSHADTNAAAARSRNGSTLAGRIKVEYLRPAGASWWSHARAVARHMGLARAPSGTWTVLLLVASMGAVVLIACRLVLKELR